MRLTSAGALFDGVQALVRVRVRGEVPVGGDLPAGEVDRLQPRLHHLHGLCARERAERGDVGLRRHQLPEALGAEARDRVLDAEATLQALDVVLRVRPLDARPTALAARPRAAHLPLLPRRIVSQIVRSRILNVQ